MMFFGFLGESPIEKSNSSPDTFGQIMAVNEQIK
jgi:hypothetical protein